MSDREELAIVYQKLGIRYKESQFNSNQGRVLHLSLHNRNIEVLSRGVFDNLSSLETLDLSSNQLTKLPTGIFDELSSLEELWIKNNKLESLPPNLFDNLPNLQKLYLSKNQISKIPPNMFENLISLKILNLQFNLITELPQGIFGKINSLEIIYLDANQIGELKQGVFDNLTSLKAIGLIANKLTNLLPDLFDNLKSLRMLDFYGNQLTELPTGIFNELILLKDLNLSHNKLTKIPIEIFNNLKSLRMLNLSSNLIKELPTGIFDKLISLENLDLSHNKLTKLPEKIFDNLSSIIELNLSENMLPELSKELFKNVRIQPNYLALGNKFIVKLNYGPYLIDKENSIHFETTEIMEPKWHYKFPLDIAGLEGVLFAPCGYCDKRDKIYFPNSEILEKTMVNFDDIREVHPEGIGAYGEIYVMHRSSLSNQHVRIYKYCKLDGEYIVNEELSNELFVNANFYIEYSYVNKYPDIAIKIICKDCKTYNLAINAFCNKCGNDIYEDFDYGKHSMGISYSSDSSVNEVNDVEPVWQYNFPFDITQLGSLCRYCDQRDTIVFPNEEILEKTMVNSNNISSVHPDGIGAYGEFYAMHRPSWGDHHVQIYRYCMMDLELYGKPHAKILFVNANFYINYNDVKKYPDVAKKIRCQDCMTKNLAINAFCNVCGNDIFVELNYGPYNKDNFV